MGYGKGSHPKILEFPELFLQLHQVFVHHRADGRAGRKKELGHIDLSQIILVRHQQAVLVEQGKGGHLSLLPTHLDIGQWLVPGVPADPVVFHHGPILQPLDDLGHKNDPEDQDDQANPYVTVFLLHNFRAFAPLAPFVMGTLTCAAPYSSSMPGDTPPG